VDKDQKPGTLCRTITLTDEPEEIDAFSGPHQRIAEALAGLIQPLDAKGISIGVEGSWGSGKSTVARLLIKKLEIKKVESDPDIAVVTFDAWAHEGDPLRRTFLETIIKKLQELNWVDRTKWEERIEELANRREVVKTKDNLSITNWGRLLAFTLLFIPIGTAFIAAALREDVTLYRGPIAWRFLIYLFVGLVLIFIPLSILLLRIKKEPDLLSLLINKGPTEKTTETSKTVNPTSIEFEKNFQELFEAALAGNQKRVVLILDNLDRVDSKDALQIWSTLQTFLQHKGTARPDWHKRVWLIVLYDFYGLRQLWESSEKISGGKTAQSFIDKSFQIRFEVPALVPSDWSTFLMAQLEKAFPDHTESDWHEVYRTLAIYVAKNNNSPPTIRELKLFVNQIGGIHRQWAACDGRPVDTFPLSHIACYVLLRPKGEMISPLFQLDFPQKEYQDLLGSSVRENLAGLAFNVEADLAQQLLFSDKIRNALMLGSARELQDVASLLPKGFWQTFEHIATTAWAFIEASKMAEVALALEESGLLNTASRPSARSVTKSFCDAAVTCKAWSPMDQNKAKGLAVLIKWKKELQTSIAQYEHFTLEMFKAIALGLNEHAMRTDLTLSAKDWLECVSVVTAELDAPLKQRALRVVFDTLSDQLRLPEPLPPKQSEPILEILSELQELPDFELSEGKTLRDLADEGRVAAQFREGLSASPGAAAWVTYVLIRYSSTFKGLPWLNQRAELKEAEVKALFSESMVQTFVGILDRFKQTALLFGVLEKAPDLRRLVDPSLEIVLNSPDAPTLFTTEDGLNRLEFVFAFRESLREDPLLIKLFSEVRQRLNLVDELTSRSFNPSNANLYLMILRTSEGEQPKFVSWCVEGLRAIGSEWSKYFYFPNTIALAFHLKRIGVEIELGEPYSLALAERIDFYKNGNWYVAADPDENLAALIGPVESPARIALQNHLYDLIKNSRELPSWLFHIFGAELETQLLHSSHGVKMVELLGLILNSGNQSGLEWLKETLTEASRGLESKYGNEPAWTTFKQEVRRALATERLKGQGDSLVNNIASILKIRLPNNGLIAFATADQTEICTLDPQSLETETLISEPLLGLTVVSDPKWSPDGKSLAYIGARAESENSEILIFDSLLGGSDPVKLTSTKTRRPSWSPDGRTLAFVSEKGPYRHILTINLETREERALTSQFGNSQSPSWSPNGTTLAFHRSVGEDVRIFLISADGSDETAITKGATDYDPSWSPGGTHIAFARWGRPIEKSGIYLMKSDGSELVQLVYEILTRVPTWSPDGTKLLFQAGQGSDARVYQIDADGKNKQELIKGTSPSWQPVLNDGPDELSQSPVESATIDSPT